MPKSKNSSPFDALRIARLSRQPDSQMSEQPAPQQPPPGLSKSKNPSYVKFTTYVPRETHTRVKSLAVRHGLELSALVGQLLEEWLKTHESGQSNS